MKKAKDESLQALPEVDNEANYLKTAAEGKEAGMAGDFEFTQSLREGKNGSWEQVSEVIEALGLWPQLNTCGDNCFERVSEGIENALKFIRNEGIARGDIDFSAFVLASIKTSLALEPDEWQQGYELMDRIIQGEKCGIGLDEIKELMKLYDKADIKENNYTTERYLKFSQDEKVLQLQRLMSELGIKGKNEEELKTDGILGPQTYLACERLKKEML